MPLPAFQTATVPTPRVFDSLGDLDGETFTDGEQVTVLIPHAFGVGATQWVFSELTDNGDYEISDASTGYFNLLDGEEVWGVMPEDFGADDTANFLAANQGAAPEYDMPLYYTEYNIRRHANSTGTLSFDQPGLDPIAADDFGYHKYLRDVKTGVVTEISEPSTTDFVPHIFEVSGVGAGSSGGSPRMFKSFVAEQDGFYLPEPTEYGLYRNQTGTGRVSAHLQLNSSTTGGGTPSNANELWREYLQKANQPAGSTTDVAVVNDNGNKPYIASVPVQLIAGATYYLYHISNTGYFRNSDTASVKFTKINTDPQLELPTSFTDLGDWNGVSLQTAVTNGMLVGTGAGAAGTGAPHGAFTGSCKITAIGDWIQQDFLTGNAPGTVVGERFSRQSFDGGTTWSAWFGQ